VRERAAIQLVLQGYVTKSGSASDAAGETVDVILGGKPEYIPEILSRTEPHDADYWIFGLLPDQDQVILDIGADYGYSAASMWAAGARAAVISFEPIAGYRPCLAAIAAARPGRYDFRIVALGDRVGTVKLVMPVLNGVGLTALTSSNPNEHLESIVDNVIDYLEKHTGGAAFQSFSVFEFESPMRPLDDLLASESFAVPLSAISAIKIDTEGSEARILTGARHTIEIHRPLILIEGANREAAVRDLMRDLGYVFAARDDRRLYQTERISDAVNGFFLHAMRLDEYRRCGLLG